MCSPIKLTLHRTIIISFQIRGITILKLPSRYTGHKRGRTFILDLEQMLQLLNFVLQRSVQTSNGDNGVPVHF